MTSVRALFVAFLIPSTVFAGPDWPNDKRDRTPALMAVEADQFQAVFNANVRRFSRTASVNFYGCAPVNGLFTCKYGSDDRFEIRATPDYNDRMIDSLFVRINTTVPEAKGRVAEALMLNVAAVFPKASGREIGRIAGRIVDAAKASNQDGTIVIDGVTFVLQTFRKDAWVFVARRK